MAFTLPFVKKVEDTPEKKHSTPLDVKKLKKEAKETKNNEKVKAAHPHIATIVYKPSLSFLKIDKYVLITIISVVFCLSGLSFWLYVQFFMSP